MNTKHQPPTDIQANPRTPARTPARGGQAKSLRRPRGSVLILVVALLVLMALIGTAWISTARIDRAASIATVNETEIEILMDGVVNLAHASLVADVSDAAGVRRAPGYNPTDSVATDAFLASRVPQFLDEIIPIFNPAPPQGQKDPPVYEKGRLTRTQSGSSGTYYLCTRTHRASAAEQPGSSPLWVSLGNYNLGSPDPFVNPVLWAGTSRVLPAGTTFEDITGRYAGHEQRGAMAPTTVIIRGRSYPGFRFYHEGLGRWVGTAADPNGAVLAADTDGDGVADANYFKLPVGRVNGLDYYAAIRIVDNGAAANVSTAMGPVAGAIAHFPSSLNLGDLTKYTLLAGNDSSQERANQMIALNDGRFDQDPSNDAGNTDETRLGTRLGNQPLSDRMSGRTRKDFNYASVQEMFWMISGRRQGNPGEWSNGSAAVRMKALPSTDAAALAFRGGTLINPDAMNKDSVAFPYYSASSLVEQLLPQTLYYSADNHPAVGGNFPPGNPFYYNDVRGRGAYVNDTRDVTAEVFARNYDYFNRWAPEDPTNLMTYHNRRALMTVSNPVSNAAPSKLNPRTGFAASRVPGPFDPRVTYDAGDCVTHNGIVYVCLSPVQRGAPVAPGEVNTALPLDHPARLINWEARPFEHFPTKASVNTSSFGQLYLAFLQTMAEAKTFKRPGLPELQTPYKDRFRAVSAAAPADLDSPYYGNRFIAGAYGVTTPGTFAPYADPSTNEILQHPLRVFRSPIRAVPATGATGATPFTADTPRLMTDHTMRLRAALAAVNAIDMRDSDDNVTFRDINIGVTLSRGSDPVNEIESVSGGTGSDRYFTGRVRVYGHERQPFITEILAQTDNTSTPSGASGLNPFGYVAVELHNPYPFPMDIRFCKLATIDRTPGNVRNLTVSESSLPTPSALQAPSLAHAKSNLAGGNTSPWLIPANGFLVLENYDATPGVGGPTVTPPPPPPPPGILPPAVYRPGSTFLPPTGAIPVVAAGTSLVRNYAYVPNLHKVFDKEMVLLRPLNAAVANVQQRGAAVAALQYAEPAAPFPGTAAVDMAPLDSYDFTGLPNPDPAVVAVSATPRVAPQAYAWHYARACLPVTNAPDTTKAGRYIYPGRYDGHQTVALAGVRRPRHQGTQEAGTGTSAGWNPAGAAGLTEDPWNPLSTTPMLPVPGITLADPPLALAYSNATYFPFEYAIQLTTSAQLGGGAAGPNPVVNPGGTGNLFPYGGFARNGDILQVPYIGSYRIKLTPYTVPPINPLPPLVTGVTSQVRGAVTDPVYHQVLELNAITMDSAFAEDSDPFNHYTHPNATTDYADVQPEQIGRFTPSRLDLEVGAAGTLSPSGSATVTPVPPPPTVPIMKYGKMVDPNRNEPPVSGQNPWTGFDIEIVDGPGKGQVRPVIAYNGGTFDIFPDWEVPLVPGVSRYILRRGTGWTFTEPPTVMPPGTFRTAGNKFWAADLFDYVCVDSPQHDNLPTADPASYARFPGMLPPQAVSNMDPDVAPAVTYSVMTGGGANSIVGSGNLIDRLGSNPGGFYAGGKIEFISGQAAGQVRHVANYNAGTRQLSLAPGTQFNPPPSTGDVFRVFGKSSEDMTGTQGLVNINTAPWPVLAMLPLVAANDFSPINASLENVALAQAIAIYRDGDPSAGIAPGGPFRSVFDLYRVPDFFYHQRKILLNGDPRKDQGDFMPDLTGGVADNVRYDFEEQYLLLNRISNMITTRSDSFTAYVLVQGWRGAGDPNQTPELVVQRRRAFVVDRTGVTPTNKDPAVQFLYND